MPASLSLSFATLYGFMLVLARVAGCLVFVPFPGMRSVAEPARAGLAVVMTLALAARWPAGPSTYSVGALLASVAAEATLGITIGLAIAIVLEAFALAAQVF